MSALSIQQPYPIFTDIDGQPLEDGYVWIGKANLDPQDNPINVYWDAALTLTAAQPIRTLAGYPSNSGTPARLYVNGDYSIRVMNKNGSVVYSAPAASATTPIVAKSAKYTVVEADNGNTLAVDTSGGDVTITLPPAATAKNGFTLTVLKTDSSSNLVIIDGDGTEKINGVETLSVRAQYGAAGIICDGAAWFAVDRTMNTQVGQSKDGMFMVSETQADFNLGSGTAPGSICTGHNRAYRSVNEAGTGTIRLITINNSNDVVISGEPQTSKVYLDTETVIVKRSAGAPTVVFDNDGGTVANGDFVGEMTFKRAGLEYGSIKALITDKTAGSEDGRVVLNLRRAGTLTTAINVDFNADTNNPISLYVNGAEYRVTADAADSAGTGYRALRIPN